MGTLCKCKKVMQYAVRHGIVVYGGGHYSTAFHCILHAASTEYCIHWFDVFAPKTMSPPPYTTIPLHQLCTAYCIPWFELFTPKTMFPPPYTTIPLCTASTAYCIHCVHCVLCPVHCVTASTASTGLTFLYQRQCPQHHIPLFHCINCVLCTASTGLTFLYQRQCPHHNLPLFHCTHCILLPLCTASTGLTFLHQRQCPHHHILLFQCIHCILHPLFWPFCIKDNVPTTIYHYSTAYCIYCKLCPLHPLCTVSTVLLRPLNPLVWPFCTKTMSPSPYTTISLHQLCTASTVYWVYCIHWFDLFAPRQCPHHHIPLFHCVHCILCPLSHFCVILTQPDIWIDSFLSILEEIGAFRGATDTPFGLLVTSPLGFKARQPFFALGWGAKCWTANFRIHFSPVIMINQIKSFYNSQFKNSHSHSIHICFPIIASDALSWDDRIG